MPAFELPVLPLTDEETVGGAAMRLLTVHFGTEAGITFPPPDQLVNAEHLFRWDPPLSAQDAAGGIIGGRSAMWHPSRNVRMSIEGPEGADFAGKTSTEQDAALEDW